MMLRNALSVCRRCHFRRSISKIPSCAKSTAAAVSDNNDGDHDPLSTLRNFGISAHIDSGKTTLTERILFYTGRINQIHEVRGKDGVGAKMDSMELEREKGITIQSAATHTRWGNNHMNIIDTPGHVDFTVEVERALRVLDGAVLVLCGVSGVQSQSITVDRQMKRYSVPRVAFINKLDREGANPFKCISDLRSKLFLNAAPVQIPIGLEKEHTGVVDLVKMEALIFEGEHGEKISKQAIPENLVTLAQEKRMEMIEALAEVDEEIAELFLMEEEPDAEMLHRAIREQTIANQFVPVFMGSAFKNKGVQPLLDAIVSYLPSPLEKQNEALDLADEEKVVPLTCGFDAPLVALAFKLEEGRFGQLTYMRIYQGTLAKGNTIFNVGNRKKIKVPRIVRMNSNEMEDIDEARAGEIVAMFGVDCSSGDTFTDGATQLSMESMFVPEPVMSLALTPDSKSGTKFGKALSRFSKEDPTFRHHVDDESKQNIVSGMGELHLQIYIERMRREFDVNLEVGLPQVNYRETLTKRNDFSYLHKKQSGGSGQYGRVMGFIEPLDLEDEDAVEGEKFRFTNGILGNAIPPEYIEAVRKGFVEAVEKGAQTGFPVENVHVTITDGEAHAVDSSELAFRAAAVGAFRQAFPGAGPTVLQPMMDCEVNVPSEYQGAVIGGLNRRRGFIKDTQTSEGYTRINATVSLEDMFGYSTDIRSNTQGKGEFTMEYASHEPVTGDKKAQLIKAYQAKLAERHKK